MAIDLGAPGDRRADVVQALTGYLGPMEMVHLDANITYDPPQHVNRCFVLAAGLGERQITVPASTSAGQSFAVFARAGSWPRIAVGPGGSIAHPLGHSRGVPNGMLSVLVVDNPDGSAAVVAISGASTT